MDLNDVERIELNALGGADNVVVGNLSGTDVTEVDVNLGSTLGGISGDGQADTVTAIATNGDDVIIGGPGDDIEINGFAAGAGSEDRLDLSAFDVSFEWLMAHASDVDGDVVLDLGGQQITLRGVSTAQLHNDDFVLS